MPVLPTRRQQPNPVTPQVPIPGEFPAIPDEVLQRFPSAKDWQARLNEFWGRTNQALQEAQRQTAAQVNSQVIWTVDRFLIYTNNGGAMPMFALDATGVKLGDVLVINTPGRKVYIGRGNYQDAQTPFYIDTLGRFSLGANLTWDPDTSTLAVTGIITATSGTIGGFTIGADYIRDTGDSFGLASTVTGGDDVRFWAGSTFFARTIAPVRIHESGLIFTYNTIATNRITLANVAGIDITATLYVGQSHTGANQSAIKISNAYTASANNSSFVGLDVNSSVDSGAFTGVTMRGINIVDSVTAGTLDTHYAIYIQSTAFATNNYGIYQVNNIPNYFAGAINAKAGSAAAPSIYFSTYTTTGLYSYSANEIGVAASGANVAIFTSTGIQAAIGATTPGTGAFTTLSASGVTSLAAGAVGAPGLYLSADTTSGLYRIGANNLGVAISGAKVLDIASTGLAVTGTLSTTGVAGIGGGPNALYGLYMQSSLTGNGAQGIRNAVTLNASANNDTLVCINATGAATTVAKGAFTGIVYYGIAIQPPTVTGTGTIATAYQLYIGAAPTATAAYGIYQGGTDANVLGGGLQMGAPTGGDKGAGTINVAADIYKNNSAYTNPDYVIEHWATGRIERFRDKDGAAEYTGLKPLREVEAFARQNLHLPRFGQDAGHGLFSGSDAMLASLEESYLYIIQLEKRITELELS